MEETNCLLKQDNYNPMIYIPQIEDIFICFHFNQETQSIEILFLNKEKRMSEKYILDNYPNEKCEICESQIIIENCFYNLDEKKIRYYCPNCNKNGLSVLKLMEKKDNSFSKSDELIDKLNSYLENNKSSSSTKFIEEMEKLVKITNSIIFLLKIFESNKEFKTQKMYLQTFKNNFLRYFEIVEKLKMNNLYLFLNNICIISIYNYEKKWLINTVVHIFKNYKNFNVSEIQFSILKDIFAKVFEKDPFENNYKEIENDLINLKKVAFHPELENINIKFNRLKCDISDNKLISFRKEGKIQEIKAKLADYLRNYFHSFEYVSSKKLLERKIINSIIFILFKYHHQLFQKVVKDDYISNSIRKELNNILKFLEASSSDQGLSAKILNEIKKFEFKGNKYYTKKYYINKDKNEEIKEYRKETEFILTEGEKEILKQYTSIITEEPFIHVYASRSVHSELISPQRLQVIIDFLFFIRDKSINIIHILEENALPFFEYLNEKFLEKIKKGNNTDILQNIIQKEDDDKIEELINYLPPKRADNHKEKNYQIFDELKIQSTKEIDSHSAFDYIFFYKPKQDYNEEIKYIYENIVLPLDNINPKKNQNDPLKRNSFQNLKNKIYNAYEKVNNLFKNDPHYKSLLNYFELCEKQEIVDISQKIQFYEQYVDDFDVFKDLYELKKEIDKSMKMIEEINIHIEQLDNIKERYVHILKEIKEHLGFNLEKYSTYYEEWKKKNPEKVVKDYELNDLVTDLKKLIPKDENITITGKDKKNFALILYLFQNDYFLKDYL